MKRHPSKPTRKLSLQAVFLTVVVAVCCATFGYMLFARSAVMRLEDIPFNGARAYEYLERLCEIGPRPSGSAGMKRQLDLLAEHFRELGGQVEFQRFEYEHPLDGSPVEIANLIVRWHPERTERILLCAHYDTLPYPMLDRMDPRGKFVGANDNASGVALLMELAHDVPELDCRYGIDFVLFDAEEFIFDHGGRFFVGSEHFARAYADDPPPYRYRWGVLLDMVGDANLQLYQESFSMGWEDTRPLVEQIWSTAERLGVRDFIPRTKHEVLDDHTKLHDIAGIPCCDVIDFDYSPWHTRADTPARCSALSLAKVGWVIREWLVNLKSEI